MFNLLLGIGAWLTLLRMDGIEAEVVTLDVSAYAIHGTTASGLHTREGVAACGPSLPFGTVAILSYREATWAETCQDRGRLVTDKHWDRFVPSYQQAIRWGRRRVKALIIKGE